MQPTLRLEDWHQSEPSASDGSSAPLSDACVCDRMACLSEALGKDNDDFLYLPIVLSLERLPDFSVT